MCVHRGKIIYCLSVLTSLTSEALRNIKLCTYKLYELRGLCYRRNFLLVEAADMDLSSFT